MWGESKRVNDVRTGNEARLSRYNFLLQAKMATLHLTKRVQAVST